MPRKVIVIMQIFCLANLTAALTLHHMWIVRIWAAGLGIWIAWGMIEDDRAHKRRTP